MLTREEAQQLVLTRLKARQDARDLFIVEDGTIERPFGWLFFLAVRCSGATALPGIDSYRLILVNKHVEQVIESSIEYTPERFIEIYETLLTKSQASRERLVLRPYPFRYPGEASAEARLAKTAKEMGLHEIR